MSIQERITRRQKQSVKSFAAAKPNPVTEAESGSSVEARPPVISSSNTKKSLKRGRIAVVRHGEYVQPHPRRDIYALRDAGFDVDVICDSEPGRPHIEHIDGVTVIRLPIRHKRGALLRYLFEYIAFPLVAGATLALRSLKGRYRYVEIDTMPTWLIVAGVVPKLLGAKVVLYMFEHMAELYATDKDMSHNHPLIRAIDAVEMACVRAADRVLTPAERNRELYISRGVDPDKILFIPNCPDERMFLPEDFTFPRPITQPVAPGQASEPFRLVTHGSLLERYGIQILIDSVKELREEIPHLELDVIGSGEFEPELLAQAKALGIEEAVNFTGPVLFEQMASRLLRADLGVGPYLLDLLPNKMMEYLLLGIPAIAADWPTMRRYFGEEAVTYIRPNDVTALTEAIRTLYWNPELRRQQAATARERFLATLAWSRSRQDYLAVYGVESTSESSDSDDEDGSLARRRGWLHFVLGQSRGPRNALQRLPTIANRFGISPEKTIRHLNCLVDVTEQFGVRPTLLVTGMTARRNPDVIRNLENRGVEIGCHGFVHNDYSQLAYEEQVEQIGLVRDELRSLGLTVRGWRCPYSRSNRFTLPAVEAAGLEYDATPVYEWPAFDAVGIQMSAEARSDYQRLCELFGVRDAADRAVLPRRVDNLVEIPMSIPQDEDMIDRLHLSPKDLERVWVWMVEESRRLGETFVICLHPERAELMAGALRATLSTAQERGDVWAVPLIGIADWWRERGTATVDFRAGRDGRWNISVEASNRVVVRRGMESLRGRGQLSIQSERKPVIGVSDLWTESTKDRIQECGYVIETAHRDSVELFLDDQFEVSTDPEVIVRRLRDNERLVRIEPWPAGYRSCLSVTGDIDAITLIDFAMRLKEFS